MENLLKECAYELGINITNNMLEKFIKYKEELIKWNKFINLTSITDEKEIILKHFIDSITVLKIINNNKNLSIIDIGTGAGFPGIPIKIVKENYKITLLDSLGKRIKFLNYIKDTLNIKNINIINARAEDAAKDIKLREQFDISVSRAVANMKILSEYNLPFIKLNGKFIALKGPNVEKELEDAKNNIHLLGGELETIKYIKIPKTEITHSLIIITKKRHTNIKYPRKKNKII